MKSLVVSEKAEEDEKNVVDCESGDVSAGFGIEECLG